MAKPWEYIVLPVGGFAGHIALWGCVAYFMECCK